MFIFFYLLGKYFKLDVTDEMLFNNAHQLTAILPLFCLLNNLQFKKKIYIFVAYKPLSLLQIKISSWLQDCWFCSRVS